MTKKQAVFTMQEHVRYRLGIAGDQIELERIDKVPSGAMVISVEDPHPYLVELFAISSGVKVSYYRGQLEEDGSEFFMAKNTSVGSRATVKVKLNLLDVELTLEFRVKIVPRMLENIDLPIQGDRVAMPK